MMKKLVLFVGIVIGITNVSMAQNAGEFTIARLKYSGGGDWYSNPTSLPNLLKQLSERLKFNSAREESVAIPGDPTIFSYPVLYMNGHGTVSFSVQDVQQLQEYFRRGGFLWADDNYGMDKSFRREIAKVFPNSPLVEIPYDHPVFSMLYKFPKGLPKIHEHDGGPPQLFGIFQESRLVVLYTFDTDIGDGMESEGVHQEDTAEKREEAMQMGINMILFVLSN